jgi:hypothetical protein
LEKSKNRDKGGSGSLARPASEFGDPKRGKGRFQLLPTPFGVGDRSPSAERGFDRSLSNFLKGGLGERTCFIFKNPLSIEGLKLGAPSAKERGKKNLSLTTFR